MTEPFARLSAALADRYRLSRELGAGGMATVYLAEDLKHDRQVAIKVLRPDLAATLGPERFLREVKIAAALQHPHVLPLYDSGQADGFLYYVMPYVEGTSLRLKLVREGELPVADAVRILRDLADAMAYAHRHGVVHRDIKPENVMLSDRHALVTDFGVAKAVSEATGRQSLTTAGVALGTPAYMAPEQAAADPHVDHRADIYAFGAVAYELLTGRPPFTGTTPQAVLAAHVTTAAEPVTKYRTAIPPVLAALVMRCLEKKPADRWQNADELMTQLETVLTPSGGMTPTGMTPTVAAPRSRSWVALAGVGVVAVAAIAFLATRRAGSGAVPPSSTALVAVLPFASRSPDTSDAYLAEQISEQIGGRLSRLGTIRVVSASAVASQLRRTPDPVEAARALKVDWYVMGSLRRAGKDLSAQAEVVRAATAVQAWSGPFRRGDDDLQALDGEVADSVAAAIGGRAPSGGPASAGPIAKRDPEAYRLFLLGNALLARRTEKSVREAVGAYEQAIARDSAFAPAWARLGIARAYQITWSGWDAGVPRDSLPALGKAAVRRAVSLDSLFGEAWLAEALLAAHADGNYRAARVGFERAIRLDSLNAEIHHAYGALLGAEFLNELDLAEPHLRRALVLDPDRPNTWRHLATLERNRGNLPRTEGILDTVVRLGPWTPAFDDRAYVRYLRKNGRGALEDLAQADQLRGVSDTVSGAAYRLLIGDSVPARQLLTRLANQSNQDRDRPAADHGRPRTGLSALGKRAWVAVALGNRAEALAALEALPFRIDTWRALNDPAYASLRDDPRFQRVLQRTRAAIKWDWSR